MKLLYGDRENLDFGAPLRLTPEQRRALVSWFRERFDCVEDELVAPGELRGWRLGDKHFSRNWSAEEDILVLRSITSEPMETEELGRRLARGGMSTMMRRVTVMDSFAPVARREGIDVYATATPESRAALEKAIAIFIARRREAEKYGDETVDEKRDRLYERLASLQSQLRTHKLLKGRVLEATFATRLRELEESIAQTSGEIAALAQDAPDDVE
ncbi:MAG TPA: hypothetical protein VFH78_06955 [Candidatus Thermoplasmatota archaeon]|nr:hypothetical protein [Candidatus Thermoplasmatota archaeon]